MWDGLWHRNRTVEGQDRYDLAKEEMSIRWRRIARRVLTHFGTFKDLRVIELGAGRGTNAALMARRGAKVTVLDYSPRALEGARDFFERNGVEADYVEANVLGIGEAALPGLYDVSMSFGLAEHFSGADRRAVFDAHFDVLAANGMTFISVPHAANPPYRLYKLFAEITGRWTVGEEYPFTRREFRRLCRERGDVRFDFFGDSLAASLHFIDPRKVARKLLKMEAPRPRIRRQVGSPFDAYLSYALVLCATAAGARRGSFPAH